MVAAIQRLQERQLWINDTPDMTAHRIRSAARQLQAGEGLGLVVIDYLQLVTPGRHGENRKVEVFEMSRQLKLVALGLNVPVVALSDKRPTLSDLRESGALEQDAAAVISLS